MKAIRRLPPLLRALSRLGMLAILASLGVNTWAFLLGQGSGEPPEHIQIVGLALLELGFVYNWMVVAYNARHPARFAPVRRPARSASWLDTWRGQLITAFIGSALPIATVVAALVISPVTPLVPWLLPVNIVFLVVWYAVLG